MPARRQRRRTRPPVRRLDVGYRTPEWGYFVGDLSPFVGWALGFTAYGAFFWLAVRNNPFGWGPGERMIASIGGVAVAYAISSALNRVLLTMGGGYGLGTGGTERLRAEFAPGRFRIRMDRGWRVFDAAVPHAFSMRAHRLGYEEGRAEERSRMEGLGPRPDYYRRGWEIVLDYGDRRFVLAAVADEDTARSIVRALLGLDAHACGTEHAGTRTPQGVRVRWQNSRTGRHLRVR